MTTVLQPRLVIAIDGPSGSGKSSTSRAVASRLGCEYLDTGSMYRALALWCTHRGIASDDPVAVARAARDLPIKVRTDPASFRVELGANDVTEQLHAPEVSGIVSGYAGVLPAREALIVRMRRIIEDCGRIVVEGRDITTVVAPGADVRVLLQADPEQRIHRREAQLDGAADHETVAEQVVGRDAADSATTRFETPADEGVHLIDSTDLTLDEVIDRVVALVPHELVVPVPSPGPDRPLT
ncbi:hypothetical protein GCM10009785_31350 [Brooklawnia cerclae]|uniref:Cytidylate kinase n=1 Tax=Brooklawnia cerclae TaxID=349934 RepID=A0ABX0SEY6_9ACTN|nr:cytidylate kinase [Brooklawnia cerclae]